MSTLSPSARPDVPFRDSLQAALAGEHAAVYGYGALGARLPPARRAAARSAQASHLARRDRLVATLRAAGAGPVAALPAYEVPDDLDAAGAVALAAAIEERVCACYADVVLAATASQRAAAAAAMGEAAVRAASWRGTSVPFPGLPERA